MLELMVLHHSDCHLRDLLRFRGADGCDFGRYGRIISILACASFALG